MNIGRTGRTGRDSPIQSTIRLREFVIPLFPHREKPPSVEENSLKFMEKKRKRASFDVREVGRKGTIKSHEVGNFWVCLFPCHYYLFWIVPYIIKYYFKSPTIEDIPLLKEGREVRYLEKRFEKWQKRLDINCCVPGLKLVCQFGATFYDELIFPIIMCVLGHTGFILVPKLMEPFLMETGKMAMTDRTELTIAFAQKILPDDIQPDVSMFREKDSVVWLYAVLIFGLFFSSLFVLNWCWWKFGMCSVKIRAVLQSRVFQKAMRLSNTAKVKYTKGAVMSLIAVDAYPIEDTMDQLFIAACMPIRLILGVYFLLNLLGWRSFMIGFLAIAVIVPYLSAAICIASCLYRYVKRNTDLRLSYVSEILKGIEIIKAFSWEESYITRLVKSRRMEVNSMRFIHTMFGFVVASFGYIPSFFCVFAFLSYIVLNGSITPTIAFVSLCYLNVVKAPLIVVTMSFTLLANVISSLGRLEVFFDAEEQEEEDDKYDGGMTTPLLKDSNGHQHPVQIVDGSFMWEGRPQEVEVSGDDSEKLENNAFDGSGTILLRDINFTARRGDLIMVTGTVGSGKSSFINAILGEMKIVKGSISVPSRKEGIAYTCQKSWVQNATLLQNVTFGLPYDKDRFDECIRVSGLSTDLNDLGSVEIEIGERGVNLSGGQKYRVQLARACYREAELYLLDDPLAAVDSHIGAYIREECILKYLKGKTRIMVTNMIQELEHADYIVLLDNGEIQEQGTFEQLIQKKGEVYQLMRPYLLEKEEKRGKYDESDEDEDEGEEFIIQEKKKEKKDEEEEEEENNNNKGSREDLMQLEESESGVLSWKTISFYIRSMGCCGFLPLLIILCLAITTQTFASGSDFYLARWLGGSFTAKWSHEYLSLFSYEVEPNEDTPEFEYVDEMIERRVAYTWDEHHGEDGNALENTPGIEYHVDYTYEYFTAPEAYNLSETIISNNITDMSLCPNIDLTSESCHELLFNAVWIEDYNNGILLQGGLTAVQAALVYFSLGIMAILCAACCRDLWILNCALNSSKRIHDQAVGAVIHAPMSFFETTPHGRITHRFSTDVTILDNRLPMSIQAATGLGFVVMGALVLVCIASKSLGIILCVPTVILYLILYCTVRHALVPLRRYETITKSPIMTTMSEAYDGIAVLRCYNSIGRFQDRIRDQIDINHRVTFMYESVSRMMRAFSRTLFSLLMLFIIFMVLPMALYGEGFWYMQASYLAMVVMCGLVMTDSIEHLNRFMIMTEVDGSFVERLQHYTDTIPQEAERVRKIDKELVNDGWPRYGEIEFIDYSLRYHKSHPYALRDLNIKMKGTIGIVGKTGSGKSTLVKSLLRLVESPYDNDDNEEDNLLTKGIIRIDGIDIRDLGLNLLRESISFIPQDPMLFQGSIKYNLDPSGYYNEELCKDALDKSSMSKRIRRRMMNNTNNDYKLEDVKVNEGGKNFSVGERQLICLSRAILKESRILVLDECTASVDSKLDNSIQKTLRTYFEDSTILTIAHRLNTVIDYERILVMKDGKVVEFDSPANLLTNPEYTEFKKLVMDTGEKSEKYLTEIALGEKKLVFDGMEEEEEEEEEIFTGDIGVDDDGDWKYRKVDDGF